MIRAIVSDFGGVLTTPLMDAFAGYQDRSGVPLEALGRAMQAASQERGENPLFVLERGEMTEADFLDVVGAALAAELGRPVEMHEFTATYFEHLHPHEEMLAAIARWRGSGLRTALCTNNVREWEPLWRSMLPVDDLFETVVDSAFVGTRKPEPRIYEIVLERLGLPASTCVFIDDLEHNIEAARGHGFHGVLFRDAPQAITEVEALLA